MEARVPLPNTTTTTMPMPTGTVAAGPTDPEVPTELAPTGRLRVAIAVGPAASAVYAIRDYPGGPLRGVTVTLAEALAAATRLPLDLVAFRSSGDIQAAAVSGLWDVSFLPADDERRRLVDFGAAYHILQSTYLVPAGSRIRRVADADADGVRITGVRDSASLRASQRAAPRATHLAVATPEDVVAMMLGGNADAIAMGREALSGLAQQIEGSQILDEIFLTTCTAVAVPKGRPRALACVGGVVEDAKARGLVRGAFDRLGLADAMVAPPGRVP